MDLQEARALLGRMEYQKGNWQGAIQLFEGIHLGGLLARMRFFASEKGQVTKKVKNSKASELSNFLHASSLLIEAIYLKAKSLQKLGALAGVQFKVLVFASRSSLPFNILRILVDMLLIEITRVYFPRSFS